MKKFIFLTLAVVLISGCSLNRSKQTDNVSVVQKSNDSIATSSDPDLPEDQSVLLDNNRPEKFRSIDAQNIKKIIPNNAFLRDFVILPNKSILVAYVLDYKLEPINDVLDYSTDTKDWFYESCSAGDFGQTIFGKYKLALISNSKIVNEIDVPFPDYEKWPDYKLDKPDENGAIGYSDINDVKGVWKNDGSLTFRQSKCSQEPDYYVTDDWKCNYSGNDFIEIPLLDMKDLTGDKLPYEARIMTEYISCGNDYYVIVGYDQSKNKIAIYPIVDKHGKHLSYSNFNPSSDGSVVFDSGCDHGSESHTLTYFEFSKKNKVYVYQKTTGIKSCEDAWATPRTYSELLKLDGKTIKPYIGKEIKWKGKIASRYSQIDGIKFCIVDDQHQNPDIHSDCEWFWAIPRELATKNDPTSRSDWNGNWNEFVFKNYSNIEYNKIDSNKDTFLITGKIEDIDFGADGLNRPIPNIEVVKIEKLK